MKRLGFRSASASYEKNAGVETIVSQTAELQLFYIVCCSQFISYKQLQPY